ncbi:MAG: hypothetical protein FJZ01_21555 [Candidatus Sericytochromatia bacterium]|nr:hypothetical protein [Candidatus Tanganyikabacteria bacterium]
MRISTGAIALGVALVAGCATTPPALSDARPVAKYRLMQVGGVQLPGKEMGQRPPGQVPRGSERDEGEDQAMEPPGRQPGQQPPGQQQQPPDQKPGQQPAGQQQQPPDQKPGQQPAGQQQQPPGQQPGQQPPGQQPGQPQQPGQQPGGGGGPQVDQQVVQQVSQALNIDIVNQAQAQAQLKTVEAGKIKMDVKDIQGRFGMGIARPLADLIQGRLDQARFHVRDGLFIPMILVGANFVPVVATVAGRPATVIFVQDCASGQLIPQTILL